MCNSIYKGVYKIKVYIFTMFILNSISQHHLGRRATKKDGLSKCLHLTVLKHCIEETIENPDNCAKVGQNTLK